MRQVVGLFEACGGGPRRAACLNIVLLFFVCDRRGRGGGRVRDERWGKWRACSECVLPFCSFSLFQRGCNMRRAVHTHEVGKRVYCRRSLVSSGMKRRKTEDPVWGGAHRSFDGEIAVPDEARRDERHDVDERSEQRFRARDQLWAANQTRTSRNLFLISG